MEIKTLVEKLESSEEFKNFIKENPGYYLVHCFKMIESSQELEWQVGYYNEENDRMVIFNTNPVKMSPEEEVFKKEGIVKKLDINKVKVSYEKAMEIAEKIQKKYFSGEVITKRIIILQHLEKQLWNITLISLSFNIINIRISAETGRIIKKHADSIMKLGKKI